MIAADDDSSPSACPEAQPPIMGELRELYSQLDGEVARLAPVCLVSGRCCRFREYGHTLFVSEPELEFLLIGAPEPARPLDDGETCPWQDAHGRCTAREARPLGCRVYFCDPAYESAAPDLSESFIARLKHLTERHGAPWHYAPLHRHLQERHAQGRFPIALKSTETR
jgi:Fe-S-cluster containining protein